MALAGSRGRVTSLNDVGRQGVPIVGAFLNGFHGGADFAAVEADDGALSVKLNFANREFVALEVFKEPFRDFVGRPGLLW